MFKINRIKYIMLAVLLCSLFVLSSCGKKAPEVIRIAVFEPMSGADETPGMQELQGVELAHDMRGEVDGRPVELVLFDNKSDINESILVANEIVKDESIKAVIGSWGSDYTIEATKIFKENQLPIISPSSTSVELTREGAWCVRMCGDEMFQGKMLARYAVEKLNISKAAILYDAENRTSLELAQYIGDAMINLTGEVSCIVYETSFSMTNSDYNLILTTISKSEPEAIFLTAKYQDSAFIIKQARAMGIDIPFIGSDVWDFDKFIEQGGSSLNGSVFSTFFDSGAIADLNEEQQNFIARFASKYGRAPVASTVLAFDAYNLLLDSIEDAGLKKPKALRDKMANRSSWQGMSGFVSTKPDGTTIRDIYFKGVQNSQFVHVNTVAVSHVDK